MPNQRRDNEIFRVEFSIGDWGYIDREGSVICRGPFEYAGKFSDGFATFCKAENFGFINSKFEIAIAPKFKWAHPFSDDRAVVQSQKEEYGVISPNGKMIVPFGKFKEIYFYAEERAGIEVSVSGKKKMGFIDPTGNIVIEPIFDHVSAFSEGLSAVLVDGKVGYINISGEFVLEPKYRSASQFHEGLALASTDETRPYGFIDKSGQFVIPPNSNHRQQFGYFSEGLCPVETSGGWAFIDRTGNYAMEPNPRLFYLNLMIEGRAMFKENDEDGNIGYFDINGHVIIPANFGDGHDFDSGLADVNLVNGARAYIDKLGEIVWRSDMDDLIA